MNQGFGDLMVGIVIILAAIWPEQIGAKIGVIIKAAQAAMQ